MTQWSFGSSTLNSIRLAAMAARLASTALWTRLAERCWFALEHNLA